MEEMWCVIECNADGEIYTPDFFKTKEAAANFIKETAKECYEQCLDLPETNIRISEDGLNGSVWTDEMSWVWRAFEVSNDIRRVV